MPLQNSPSTKILTTPLPYQNSPNTSPPTKIFPTPLPNQNSHNTSPPTKILPTPPPRIFQSPPPSVFDLVSHQRAEFMKKINTNENCHSLCMKDGEKPWATHSNTSYLLPWRLVPTCRRVGTGEQSSVLYSKSCALLILSCHLENW